MLEEQGAHFLAHRPTRQRLGPLSQDFAGECEHHAMVLVHMRPQGIAPTIDGLANRPTP